MGNRIKIEMLDETAQAAVETSHHGLRTERTRTVLQVREIATATVIDFLTAKEDGEIRNVMIEETEAATGAIVATEDGIEIGTNGKSASQSGWMSQPRTKARSTPKKIFRNGGSNSTRRTKLARHLPKM